MLENPSSKEGPNAGGAHAGAPSAGSDRRNARVSDEAGPFLRSEPAPTAPGRLLLRDFAIRRSLGLVQSSLLTLKGDFRYTSDTVFDTFPWPQAPTLAQVKAVAEAAVAPRALRREIMQANGWSLRELYRSLETPGTNRLRDAHAALDAAVCAAYGMKSGEDPLGFLLALNLELGQKEAKGEAVTPPGLPLSAGDASQFVTEDCITVPV